MSGKTGPETRLVAKMRKAGIEAYGETLVMTKNHGSMYSEDGVSDLTGVLAGLFVAVEVKAPESYLVKGQPSVEKALAVGPTVKQREFIRKVLAAGGVAGFAATVEQYMEILDCAWQRDGGWGGCGHTCSGHYTEVTFP
jgi:hypothetical protein